MKKTLKKTAGVFLVVLFLFSVTPNVFSETGEELLKEQKAKEAEENKSEEAELVKQIARNLEAYTRYPGVNQATLYAGAMNSILKENPELLDTALSGMLASIDEHSVYYTPEERNDLFDNLSDEIVGIGVTVLSRDGKILVSQPIPGTPAEKAGIIAGDIIVEADGISLDGMDLDMAIEHIRGVEGTQVTVKVWRSTINGYLSFTMIREKVVSNPVEYEEIEKEDGTKIAKIQIFSFTQNADVYFEEAMKKADAAGITNIILDLRNNGGGYLDSAVRIADVFLQEGAIVTSEDHKIPLFNKVYMATGEDTKYETVVLINGMSASASEVLTAALKENGKAKVIGTNSFGKGTVQTIAELANGGVMKYTIAYYLTPKGNNINEIGIAPDAVVENTLKNVDISGYGEFNYNQAYKLGDKAPQIETAKKMLEYIGLYIGEINDTFDENLKIAVYAFQEMKEGLYPYGELDKTTQLSLYTTMSELKEEVDDQMEAALAAF